MSEPYSRSFWISPYLIMSTCAVNVGVRKRCCKRQNTTLTLRTWQECGGIATRLGQPTFRVECGSGLQTCESTGIVCTYERTYVCTYVGFGVLGPQRMRQNARYKRIVGECPTLSHAVPPPSAPQPFKTVQPHSPSKPFSPTTLQNRCAPRCT